MTAINASWSKLLINLKYTNYSLDINLHFIPGILLGLNLVFLVSIGDMLAAPIETDNETDQYDASFNEDMSEGDLKLSKEMIAKYYNFCILPEGEAVRGGLAELIHSKNNTENGRDRKVRAVGSLTIK